MTDAALAAQGGLALLPCREAATDEPAVPTLDRRAPPRLTMGRRARERSGDGNAEHEPGAPSWFATRDRQNNRSFAEHPFSRVFCAATPR